MRSRVPLALTLALWALGALPAPASPPRVHVHLGFGWWSPWWWWGPVVVAERPALSPAGWTVVDTDVAPEHALVYLDGQLIGTADDFDGFPDYLYLRPPGRYELEFRLHGFESYRLAVDAAENLYVPINVRLARAPGERPAPWYDRPVGLPTTRAFAKDRPAGRGGPGGEGARPDPALRPELRPGAPGRPAEKGSSLVLAVAPDNAAVYLDGEFLGTGAELRRLERGVAVPAGPHTLEVVAPGFRPRRVEVEVEEGERRQVVVELERAGPEGG